MLINQKWDYSELVSLISVFSCIFFLSRPQLLVLPLTICYFAPSLRLIPQQHLIFPVISLCDSSRCTPVKVLQIPLPLKPEGLSRSTQITSPRLCICFQFCAINKAGLRMFLSISYSSFSARLATPQPTARWNMAILYVSLKSKQRRISQHMFVSFLGWATSEKQSSHACLQQNISLPWSALKMKQVWENTPQNEIKNIPKCA